ncbi:MAG: Holliday junction branch migration protein RuvA [Calditrichia bacterium]
MIERISGRLLHKTPTFCVINCGGIGIGVYISVNTYRKLEEENDTIDLLTHLHVREDALQLYGFFDEEERNLFRQLIGVGGIGPRLAITVLSGIEAAELKQAIAMEDSELLQRTPGIGKKTAQRIILELKEKIKIPAEMKELAGVTPAFNEQQSKINEAVLALTTLGYKHAEARKAIHKVLQSSSDNLSLDELIKQALREV